MLTGNLLFGRDKRINVLAEGCYKQGEVSINRGGSLLSAAISMIANRPPTLK